MMKGLLAASAAVALAACASAPVADPTPTAVDLAGTYAFSTTVQGMAVEGRMRVTGEPGAYRGSLFTELTGQLPLREIRIDGQEVLMWADSPDGPVRIRLVFSGDGFTGDWALGAEGASLRGRRVQL